MRMKSVREHQAAVHVYRKAQTRLHSYFVDLLRRNHSRRVRLCGKTILLALQRLP